MKLGVVLHERHALAFDRVGHDAGGLALGGLGFFEGLLDGNEVVAVDFEGMLAECAPLLRKRLERQLLPQGVIGFKGPFPRCGAGDA